ncbi:MAG: hypothetical protein JNM62_08140 [Flavobacteriales bacterium]|nr:hypothetical protein [Flavobacteriales bacterium]
MQLIKRTLGLVCMMLGPLAIWYLVSTASSEIARKPGTDTWIQWGVFVGVFLPIAIGLVLFGYYALRGEYDRLPSRSDEL